KESADSKTLSAVPFRPSALSSASSKPLTIPVTSEAALSSAPARSCMRPAMLLASESIVLAVSGRSEEHTSELQSRFDLVCRLLLEKKKETYPIDAQILKLVF